MKTAQAAPDGEGAAALAEQALLGALLWDPARLAEVTDWLGPEDFYLPGHQAIYRTISGLRGGIQQGADPRTVLDARTVLDSLADGEFHDLHVPSDGTGSLGASGLHTLMAMTPAARHGHDARHVAYGRLVLEAAIRRQVRQAGACISQWAGVLSQSGTGSEEATFGLQRAIAAGTDRLTLLSARALAAPGDPRAASIGWRPNTAEATSVPAAWDQNLAAAEYSLVGACLESATFRAEALTRLVPADFADPGCAATWAAIAHLAEDGGPVDFILVAAEVERAAPVRGRGLPAEQLLHLAQRNSGQVMGYRALRVLTRSALTRIAAHTAALLDTLVREPGRPAPELITAARSALVAAAEASHRVVGSEAGQNPNRRDGPAAAAAQAARAISVGRSNSGALPRSVAQPPAMSGPPRGASVTQTPLSPSRRAR